MTSALPPYPYYKGIKFNPAFFNSSYITQDEANKLYLMKAYPDTAIAKETFSAGIVASSITTNNGNLIMGTGQITCGDITSTAGGFGNGIITANGGLITNTIDTIVSGALTLGSTLCNAVLTSQSFSSNSYLLNGTTPTITKTSLGYFVNYDFIASPQLSASGSYYLYSPTTNSTKSASNYLNAGYYLIQVNSSVCEKGSPSSGVVNYTIAFCYGTTKSDSALSTTAQYGTIGTPNINFPFSVNLNLNNVSVGNNLTCGFFLPTEGFINLELICNITTVIASGSIVFNVSGCITRIA